MWKQEIHNLLIDTQIDFETIENKSVFKLIFIPQHQLFLNLINLQKFQESNLETDYFQNLSDHYNTQNQRIIHLWEDVFVFKPELVKSRILAMLGRFIRLHARHCIVKKIDKPTSDTFLEINHLQGSVTAKSKYGLFLKPQYVERFMSEWSVGTPPTAQQLNNSTTQQLLIAVATFSGGRLMKFGERAGTRSYELVRFASLKGYVVVGGMDKLLKAFIEEHQPDDIMSYADRDWSDGRSYLKLGFDEIESTTPQTFYVNLNTSERLPISSLIDDKHLEIFNAGSIKFIKSLRSFI